MKKERITAFISGVLCCALVFSLATTALAVTGAVSFGTVNLKLNRKPVFEQGAELTNDAGRAIPSSITYTDEGGGDTTYLPLAYVSRLLDTQIGWEQATKTVKLGYGAVGEGSGEAGSGGSVTEGPSSGLTDLPLHAAGSIAAPFAEIEPISTDDMTRISYAIAPTDITSQDGYENAVPMSAGNGKYCSITVTNHNDYPLSFALGRQYNQSAEEIYTHIPAGETVTRTVQFEKEDEAITSPKLLVKVGYYDNAKDMHITIKGVQFGK